MPVLICSNLNKGILSAFLFIYLRCPLIRFFLKIHKYVMASMFSLFLDSLQSCNCDFIYFLGDFSAIVIHFIFLKCLANLVDRAVNSYTFL